jgi:exodeoxyribonuclease VII small subunit
MPDPDPLHFEQALAELERILRDLEDGTTSLEDALARYERGIVLLRQCYGQLKDAEQRIRLLAGTDDEGTPALQRFEHVASIETARASVRRPRASTKEPGIPD